MAQVLLPCDLPSWPEVRQRLLLMKSCSNGQQLALHMADICSMCRISLDLEEDSLPDDYFEKLAYFVEDVLGAEERLRFLRLILPAVVEQALRLERPPEGMLYSLKGEEKSFRFDRGFAASLLANAFLCTFPKRSPKTHPTLQDFSFAEFFAYLDRPEHQEKLKSFLKCFEFSDPKGFLVFTRKVSSDAAPSLPTWLCSDLCLTPLLLRSQGSLYEAEADLYRACSCSPLIGGDVLKEATSQEAALFFRFPELMIFLSFVESLGEKEALIAEGIIDPKSSEAKCFYLTVSPSVQFDDTFLLDEFNRTLLAFSHEILAFRYSPIGESSSSSKDGEECSSISRTSMRTGSQSSADYFTADEESDLKDVSESYRDESIGFVLDTYSSHERLGDFQKRIRKRTRRRRRSSSYTVSSSDMEDISEDDEPHHPIVVRPTNSEPSLGRALVNPEHGKVNSELLCTAFIAFLCIASLLQPEVSYSRGLMVTSSRGKLKAYSYDGVRPNLPVPFKVKFKKKQESSSLSSFSLPSLEEQKRSPVVAQDEGQLKVIIHWLAASMARLPFLVVYTQREQALQEVHQTVINRGWTVGDLSCEMLRYCRNKVSSRRCPALFAQLTSSENLAENFY